MSERKKVLIVDDDPDFVEGIKAILDNRVRHRGDVQPQGRLGGPQAR